MDLLGHKKLGGLRRWPSPFPQEGQVTVDFLGESVDDFLTSLAAREASGKLGDVGIPPSLSLFNVHRPRFDIKHYDTAQ